MQTSELVKLNGWEFDLSAYENRDHFTHTVWQETFGHYDQIDTTVYAVAVANRVESAAKVLWDINQ